VWQQLPQSGAWVVAMRNMLGWVIGPSQTGSCGPIATPQTPHNCPSLLAALARLITALTGSPSDCPIAALQWATMASAVCSAWRTIAGGLSSFVMVVPPLTGAS
jgi:hypothetical protein